MSSTDIEKIDIEKTIIEKVQRVVILGLSNSGKSSILYSLIFGKLVELTPTKSFNQETIKYRNHKFIFYDVSGSKNMIQNWKQFFILNPTNIIYVIDGSHPQLFKKSIKKLNHLLSHLNYKPHVLLLINKTDLSHQLDIQSLISELDFSLFQLSSIQPCSVLTGDGICSGLDWFIKNSEINLEE